MKFPGSLRGMALLLVLAASCCLTAGCTGGHAFPHTDILVSKFSPGGTPVWSTPVDSGKDDYANTVIATSDGGYAVAGWVADSHGAPNSPRIIRLDGKGKVLWDRTLDASDVYALAIAETRDDGFVVAENINNYDAGRVVKVTADGNPAWDRSFPVAFRAVLAARDGSIVLAGGRTLRLDADGTTLWDQPVETTSIIEREGGGYYAERSGMPYAGATVFSLYENGTPAWGLPVGMQEMGSVPSLTETADGGLEAVHSYWNMAKDRDNIMFMESERITIGPGGTITDRQPLAAVSPMTRAADGGYVFLAFPFPGGAGYTTQPSSPGSSLHLVRLSPEGAVEWDRDTSAGSWNALQAVIMARDGGYVTLVVTGS